MDRNAIIDHNTRTLIKSLSQFLGPSPTEGLAPEAVTAETVLALEAYLEKTKTIIAMLKHPELQPDIRAALTTRRHAFRTLHAAMRKRLIDAPARRREQTRARVQKSREREQAAVTPEIAAPFGFRVVRVIA